MNVPRVQTYSSAQPESLWWIGVPSPWGVSGYNTESLTADHSGPARERPILYI